MNCTQEHSENQQCYYRKMRSGITISMSKHNFGYVVNVTNADATMVKSEIAHSRKLAEQHYRKMVHHYSM